MSGIATGFLVIGVAVLTGYIIGRIGLLGQHGKYVLSRLTFFVLSPFLLFYVLAAADLQTLFSSLLPVSALAAIVIFAIYALVASLIWKRRLGDTTIGALAAGQVNSNNMGIPIAAYVLGDGALSAPVILVQLIVFTPLSLTVLDTASNGGGKFGKTLLNTLTNPMIVGSALGVIVALVDVELPAMVLEPIELIANAAIPVLLISFGMSLTGRRVLTERSVRKDILLASALKLFVMPATAWAIGAFLFGLTGHALLTVVVLAALPTAQNVFNYAQRYELGETLARDVVFVTTVGYLPVLIAIVAILG